MVQFAADVRRVLHKTRPIFSRINGPIVEFYKPWRLVIKSRCSFCHVRVTRIQFTILIARFSRDIFRIELDCKNYKNFVTRHQKGWKGTHVTKIAKLIEWGQDESAQGRRLKRFKKIMSAKNLTKLPWLLDGACKLLFPSKNTETLTFTTI